MKKVFAFICAIILFLSLGTYLGISFVERETKADLSKVNMLSKTIAIVNLDEGVDTELEITEFYSSSLLNLLDGNYVVESANNAINGLNSGRYGAIITFPSNTSQAIESLNSDSPVQLTIEYVINSNLNSKDYLEVSNEIIEFRDKINNSLSYVYVLSILNEFHDGQDTVSDLTINNENIITQLESIDMGNYIDGLNLESLPTVELELSVIGFDEYASEASDYASDVISIYEGSYNDAQIAFDEIEQGLTNYVNNVSIEGNNWYIAANEYRDYLSSQSEVISNNFITLSNYYDELSTWHTGLSSYADYLINSNNQNIHYVNYLVNGVNSYANAIEQYVNNSYLVLDSWRSGVSDEVIYLNSQAQENNEISQRNNERINELNSFYYEVQSVYNNYAGLNSLIENFCIARDNYQQALGNEEITEDELLILEEEYEDALERLAYVQISDYPQIDYEVAFEQYNEYIPQIVEMPYITSVPNRDNYFNYSENDGENETTTMPEAVSRLEGDFGVVELNGVPGLSENYVNGMNGIIRLSQGYNPNSYLNEITRNRVSNRLSEYNRYNTYVQSEIENIQVENNVVYEQARNEYAQYLISLYREVTSTYSSENEELQNSIDAFEEYVTAVCQENDELIGRFANLMPETRSGSDTDIEYVDAIIMPVEFNNSSELIVAKAKEYGKVKNAAIAVMAGCAFGTVIFTTMTIIENRRSRRWLITKQ